MVERNFTLTTHCLVKNEENFIGFAIESVVHYVDSIIVFDTGSEDATVEIIKKLQIKYPDKILFEEKGLCTKEQHTNLRNEMIQKTKTDWFMILDGDEVWTKRGMEEAILCIYENGARINYVLSDIYLCVGDVFHDHNRSLMQKLTGIHDLRLSRFYKYQDGMRWVGEYGVDQLYSSDNKVYYSDASKGYTVTNKFWHVTHLQRSSVDENDYTSNSTTETRGKKRRKTYFLIGVKINEHLPEVFDNEFLRKNRRSAISSFMHFWPYFFRKLKSK